MKTKVILGAITLEGEQRSAGIARRYVTERLTAKRIEPDDAVLVASELVTNALQHGPDGRIGVTLGCDDEVVRIEVLDGGRGTDAPLARREVPNDRECGRGLLIVDRLAKRWGTCQVECGTLVWADIARS